VRTGRSEVVPVQDVDSQGRSFPVLVIDEATQATEPASLVPIMARVSVRVGVRGPASLVPIMARVSGCMAG
jgi:hypothetical protein